MSKSLSLSLCTIGCLYATTAQAQVTSDGTVNTQVNQNGSVAEITGGETRGGNLFHSFQDFSVPSNNETFFNNAESIANIFSRVTGGNVSNIDGLIRANGSASLFLINPAGIVFGEGARLELGGSFFGSTASSILFEDGEFSAVDNIEQPILTVNAPIGLGFRDNPRDIVNRSRVENSFEEVVGLEISSGNNLAFIGGNLNFEGGNVTARGGNIYLGGLAQAGIVGFNEDGTLTFPEDLTLSNITLTNAADVDVRGTGGGSIAIDARSLSLEAGELGRSSIRGGIASDSTSTEAQAGDITINIAENITSNASSIVNLVYFEGVGNSGNININTSFLELVNGAEVGAFTFGQGNTGSLFIKSNGLEIDGGENGLITGLFAQVGENAVGQSGSIFIGSEQFPIQQLTLKNGALILANTFGQGNAGNLSILAKNIDLDGGVDGILTGLFAQVGENATGEGGSLNLGSQQSPVRQLNLANRAQISVSTFGQGKAGSISIFSDNTQLQGNGSLTGLFASVESGATGQGGNIFLNTDTLTLTEGGRIAANVQNMGQGNAGVLEISAKDSIIIDGTTSAPDLFPSAITSVVDGRFKQEGGVGDGGNITVSTSSLFLTNGGRVSATSLGQGNGGNLSINASESIFISGFTEKFRGGIVVDALVNNGNGGNANITTDRLTIENGGTIEASNIDSLGFFPSGTGEPGNINIQTDFIELNNGGRIEAATQSETGEGANIFLQVADRITLRDNSFISAQAFGEADGGNLSIDARYIIAFPSNGTGNDLVATADRGTGGNIDLLDVRGIFGLQPGDAVAPNNEFIQNGTNDIDASSNVEGFDGNILIDPSSFIPIQGVTELPTNIVVPEQTVAQACRTNRETTARSSFSVKGKGGVAPEPSLPLDTLNVYVDGEDTQADLPKALETARGKIQPAQGVRVTEKGIMLTAYQTNSEGNRIPEDNSSCGI